MDLNDKGISVILPTLNEAQNLKKIIPSITNLFEGLKIENYEILVIDDNSTDNTEDVISSLNKNNLRIKLHIRKEVEGSLPLSILKGIQISEKDFVIWLDADGSMTSIAINEMILELMKDENSVIIGSRFVEGGGYKGVRDIKSTSIFQAIKNVRDSNDSVLGMVLSIIFNKFLRLLFSIDIYDLTSGFILGKREYFTEDSFIKSDYGEYFIYIVNELIKNNIKLKEVGYICETREFGVSKTSETVFQLIKRGIPYIKVAILCRIENHGNKR